MNNNFAYKACVVLPTYNEAKNIRKVLDRITHQQKKLKDTELHILVVDDSSPDGTGKKVRKYQAKNERVHLLTREEKEGLGAAYIAGMSHALEKLEPDIILEMDADLSHDPDDIPRLIKQVHEGQDFVIGSRYVEGGSIPADWGFKRRFISAAANSYLRFMLGMGAVKDCTGGFRAIRTSTLKRVDLKRLQAKGYAFQIALLHAARRTGARIKEIPIAFRDRTQGTSKLGMSDMVELGLIVLPLWKSSRGRVARKEAVPQRAE